MKFLAEDDKLTVSFEGLEIFWAFRRRLVIPRAAITSLNWMPQFSYQGNRFFRLGGVGLPGLLYAGNFRAVGGDWYFLYVSRPRGIHWLSGGPFTALNTLDIVTQDYRYGRIMISCRPDIGAGLMNWFKNI
jgi:hypothetical protein